jgi:HK97 family phage major capsid protein
MPLPTPNSGEDQDQFIARCMGDDAMQEYDQEQRAAICYSQYRERSAKPRSKGMAYRDKLHELQRRRAAKRAELDEIMKADDSDDGMNDDDKKRFDEVMAGLQALEERIARCERAMEASVKAADNGDEDDKEDDDEDEDDDDKKNYRSRGVTGVAGIVSQGGMRVLARPKNTPVKTEPGYRLVRFMIGLVQERWHGTQRALEFLDNRFHDDVVTRALREKALDYSVVAEGGALIPQDFMAEMIELLRSTVVVRAAGPMTVQMPMGNLTIPRLAGGGSAVYQGELDDISVTQETFDDLDLIAKKLTAMVPVSNDLIRRAPIGVESIVRDDLAQAIAHREDVTFIRGDGTNKGPVGWRSLVLAQNLLVVPLLGVTPPAGADLNAVVSTLASMKVALQNGMSRMLRPAWFMAPIIKEYIATRRDSVGSFYYKDELSRNQLEGYPVYVSQQIPTNLGTGNGSELYLVDMADTIIGDTMNSMIDASDVAAYYGTDGKVVSTFQRDQSLFRVIAEHDFNMRHYQSLAIATMSDWAFPTLPGVPGAPWSSQPLNPHWAQAPAAWPAAVTHDAAPTIYDPNVVHTSAFAGTLTSNPGGGPYPLPMGQGEQAAEDTLRGGRADPPPTPDAPPTPPAPHSGGRGR